MRLVFALVLLLPAAASAEERIDCKHTTVQPDMNACAEDAYQKADAALNKLYAGIIKGLDAGDAGRLRAAERAWVAFRDAECLYRVGGEEAMGIGASMGPMIYANCQEAFTKERIGQLKDDASGPQ
jgi:uncharacterized protein YecT (DUF1311 family)